DQVSKLLRNLAERTHELEAQISERQRAESDLQASEKKYRTLFEDSKDVIFIADTEGRLVDINPAGVSLSGYSKAELLVLSIQDQYVKREDLPRFLKEMEKHGSVKDFAVKFYRKNGSEADCLMTATTRQADDGTVIGYQGIIRDITEQKQVERERLRLMAIERELAIAHEIQESLLPPPKPNWGGPEVLAYTTSAREVGGDFYAYYAFDDNRFAITVGDVSGKGMPAALLMAVSLSSLQAIVPQNLAPGLLLRHLDQAIAPYTGATGQNCALVYVELIPPTTNGEVGDEVKRGILRVANAGCIIPLIRRTDGSVSWVNAFGFPLGMKLGSEFGYRELEVPVSAGDLVILTSDGLVE
ncbi:MAG TPA: PAS domain S-box protein, partial [Anaerolineae bacterium]|nr:PAS domain S-box protein [Anaerolineae bacterium]